MSLMQPHPLDVGLILLTDTSNQTGLESRWNHVGAFLGAGAALEHAHIERVVIAGLPGQQFALLQAGGVLDRVVHHFAETHWGVGCIAAGNI